MHTHTHTLARTHLHTHARALTHAHTHADTRPATRRLTSATITIAGVNQRGAATEEAAQLALAALRASAAAAAGDEHTSLSFEDAVRVLRGGVDGACNGVRALTTRLDYRWAS
jgi:hypothetical protein